MFKNSKINSKKKRDIDLNELTPWERQQLLRKETIKQNTTSKKKPKKRMTSNLVRFNSTKRKRLAKNTTILLGIFTILLILSGYLISPLSRVKNVKLTGVDEPSKEAILQASGIHDGESRYAVLLQEKKIIRKIKSEVNTVKSANISMEHNEIKISITQYRISGYLKEKGKYYKISYRGDIDKNPQDNVNNNLPVFVGFKKRSDIVKCAQELGKLQPKINRLISEVHYVPTKLNSKRVRLIMNDGNEVLGNLNKLSVAMPYYPSMSKSMKEKGIIDIQVGAYSYPYSDKK